MIPLSRQRYFYFLIQIVFALFAPLTQASPACVKYWQMAKTLWNQPLEEPAPEPWIGVEVEALAPYEEAPEKVSYYLYAVIKRPSSCSDMDYQKQDTRCVLPQIRGKKYYIMPNPRAFDQIWESKIDTSIEPYSEGQSGVEIASPILKDDSEIANFRDVIPELTARAGLFAAPLTAGIHVHVNAGNNGEVDGILINLILAIVEDELRFVFRPSLQRMNEAPSRYIDRVFHWHQSITGQISTTESDGNLLFQSPDKLVWVNLLCTHGTIEFRLFNSSLDPQMLGWIIRFVKGLTQLVQTRDPDFFEKLNARSGQFSFDELLSAIDESLLGELPEIKEKVLNELKIAIEQRAAADLIKEEKAELKRKRDVKKGLVGVAAIYSAVGTYLLYHWLK